MAVNVEIPELGESVTEAILVEWLKQDGDRVELDESVCVIETDKADAELPAPAAGVVTRITKEGDTVLVGEAVATIDDSADGQAAAPAAELKAAELKAAAPAEAAAAPGSSPFVPAEAAAAPGSSPFVN